MKNIKIIGIAGGTASGKTTFSSILVEQLAEHSPLLITLDSYYSSQDHIAVTQRANVNYDHPSSFEISLLTKHLETLLAGQSVEIPCYDYSRHTRSAETIKATPSKLIILEGILTLHYQEILPLLNFKIFMDTPTDLRYQWRLARDIKERGRTPLEVKKQWEESVNLMHNQFCEPTKKLADLIIAGDSNYQEEALNVINLLNLNPTTSNIT